jgi:hypothetical protein
MVLGFIGMQAKAASHPQIYLLIRWVQKLKKPLAGLFVFCI